MRPMRASCASAPSSPSDSWPRKRIRSPSPPGSSWSRVEASWARSQRSRSSRSSASIIESSSARCSGERERMSDCMAAIRSASWAMTSSSVRAPGKKPPCCARKASTSACDGSSPARRRLSSRSRSRTISRFAASCSGVASPDGIRHALERGVEHLALEPFARAPGSDPASGSRKSYSPRARMRSPTSSGNASSRSWRRAARSAASRSRPGSSPALPAIRRSMPRRSVATMACQLLADVAQHVIEPVAREGGLALLGEPPSERIEALDLVAQPRRRAAAYRGAAGA